MTSLHDVVVPLSSVIAVSGGVDSMVLLDLARQQLAADKFVVAHLNHGTRPAKDHAADRSVISDYCRKYKLQLEVGKLQESEHSEARLRKKRYQFLNNVKDKYEFSCIVTAHHQDDVIETAIINLIRGTGPRGMVSLDNHEQIQRPFINLPKMKLCDYATTHNLKWNEDTTNQDESYLRNYIRLNVVSKLSDADKKQLITLINEQRKIQTKLQSELNTVLKGLTTKHGLNRSAYVNLPYALRQALMHYMLARQLKLLNSQQPLINSLLHFVCTAKAGARWDVSKDYYLAVNKQTFELKAR